MKVDCAAERTGYDASASSSGQSPVVANSAVLDAALAAACSQPQHAHQLVADADFPVFPRGKSHGAESQHMAVSMDMKAGRELHLALGPPEGCW